ncbi:MAG: DNA adenine methylase [Phaeodactylibacter sp.]|nr:DNA adenine methylase [Phaeodactylibacter sp.]
MSQQHRFNTPLRYPGGKARVAPFIEDILLLNNLEGCTLYELYAGGAGASINLLFSGMCERIVLNDLDYHIYAFWDSVLRDTEAFVRRVHDTPIDVATWRIQKHIYDNYKDFDLLDVAFSTFFLNRSNRSGILYKAGPIGGLEQNGNYKIDVRFNKDALIRRIERIAQKSKYIEIHNLESKTFLKNIFGDTKGDIFVFLDPPYYVQGENLYMSFYTDEDHVDLCRTLTEHRSANWLLTYDNCPRINELYTSFRRSYLPMSYTLQRKRSSKEVAIFSDELYLPQTLRMGKKSLNFSLIG